jgi:hypothetical protein
MKQKHGMQARALADMALAAIVLFSTLFNPLSTNSSRNFSSSKPETNDLDERDFCGVVNIET